MKRNTLATLILAIAILVTGCSSSNSAKNISPEDQGPVSLDHKIEQVVLTKGYQNTDPKVELVQKNNETRLLVYPGLLKSAGIEVEDITIEGGKITVSLINQDNPNSELVIPQIMIHLTDIDPGRAAGAAFSINNVNYKPIKVSYGIVDVLNKLKADMKISTSTSPQVRLLEDGEKLFWEITYENIFDKDSKEVPLINLKTVVDSTTGQLVMSSKSLISSLVDEGKVLRFNQNYGMLYINDLPGDKGSFDSCLWLYDVENETKIFLYGSNHSIDSAEFSKNGKNISFIENDGTHSMLYVLQLKDMKVVKVALPGDFVPIRSVWEDGDKLYVSEAPLADNTRIMIYDLSDNSLETSHTFELPITSLIMSDDTVAIAERDGENTNRRLHTSYKGGQFKLVGTGWNLTSLEDNRIGYLEHDQKNNINALVIFNVKDNEEIIRIERNFASMSYIDKDSLLLVERINGGSDFSLSLLDLTEGTEAFLGKAQSEKVFLHKNSGSLFVDLVIPFQSEMSEIIYTIRIDSIK